MTLLHLQEFEIRPRNGASVHMVNIASALENLKTIRSATDKLNNLPLQQSLLDLQGQLLTLQVCVLEREVENRALLNELSRLQECRETDRRLERVFGAYMLVDGPRDRRGPFCVPCWDNQSLLQELVDAGDVAGYCPSCKTEQVLGPVSANGTTGRAGHTPLRNAAV